MPTQGHPKGCPFLLPPEGAAFLFSGTLWEIRAMTDIVPGDRHGLGPRNDVVIGWLILLAGIGRLLMAGRRGQCRPPYGWLFWMVRIRCGCGGLGRWYRGTVMTVPYNWIYNREAARVGGFLIW